MLLYPETEGIHCQNEVIDPNVKPIGYEGLSSRTQRHVKGHQVILVRMGTLGVRCLCPVINQSSQIICEQTRPNPVGELTYVRKRGPAIATGRLEIAKVMRQIA
jgi:hypothetical protein